MYTSLIYIDTHFKKYMIYIIKFINFKFIIEFKYFPSIFESTTKFIERYKYPFASREICRRAM